MECYSLHSSGIYIFCENIDKKTVKLLGFDLRSAEWRTQQALEFENKDRQFTKEECFEDDQIVYLLVLHASALQTSTTKFRQDFI